MKLCNQLYDHSKLLQAFNQCNIDSWNTYLSRVLDNGSQKTFPSKKGNKRGKGSAKSLKDHRRNRSPRKGHSKKREKDSRKSGKSKRGPKKVDLKKTSDTKSKSNRRQNFPRPIVHTSQVRETHQSKKEMQFAERKRHGNFALESTEDAKKSVIKKERPSTPNVEVGPLRQDSKEKKVLSNVREVVETVSDVALQYPTSNFLSTAEKNKRSGVRSDGQPIKKKRFLSDDFNNDGDNKGKYVCYFCYSAYVFCS